MFPATMIKEPPSWNISIGCRTRFPISRQKKREEMPTISTEIKKDEMFTKSWVLPAAIGVRVIALGIVLVKR